MTEEVTMQPEEENEQEAQAQPQAQPTVAAEDPYASQADVPDENRIWPPPPVKNHG